jgi:hypothetical protein
MKPLTKSDLVNIDAFKALLRLVSNDIKDVKASSAAPNEKAKQIFKLYRDKGRLLNQATEKYPQINWLNEALGPETGLEVANKQTIKMKIEAKFNLN